MTNVPVRVNGVLEKKLKEKAKKVLALQRRGSKLIFPDVLGIEKKLLEKNKKDDNKNTALSDE